MPHAPGVLLVEDAAGSYGAQYQGTPLGASADASIMSFHTSKGVSSGGEGGCVLTNDAALASDVLQIAKHGQSAGYYDSSLVGTNSLMTDLSAHYLLESMNSFESNRKLRERVKTQFDRVCEEFDVLKSPSNTGSATRNQNYQAFLVLEPDRDFLLRVLRLGSVEARPCWPRTILQQRALSPSIKRVDHDAANSTRLASLALNFPLHPGVSEQNIALLRSALAHWRG